MCKGLEVRRRERGAELERLSEGEGTRDGPERVRREADSAGPCDQAAFTFLLRPQTAGERPLQACDVGDLHVGKLIKLQGVRGTTRSPGTRPLTRKGCWPMCTW